MKPVYEWDRDKEAENRKKHDVSFDEAATVFSDPLARLLDDPDHSTYEERFVAMGRSYRGRILFVACVERRGTVRIISARRATPRERMHYEEGA